MQLECPNCRGGLVVPDRLRRYYDMPVRCQACRHVFTVKRRTPHDAAGGALQDAGQSLDRSVSARQDHHRVACHHCGAGLRVPGQNGPGPDGPRPDGEPLTLTCPYCHAIFCHHDIVNTAWLDRLIIGLGAAIIAGGGILWGQYEGFIELRNLGDGTWLATLRQMFANLIIQLKTAAMARLV